VVVLNTPAATSAGGIDGATNPRVAQGVHALLKLSGEINEQRKRPTRK
jgi:hypothetical protein